MDVYYYLTKENQQKQIQEKELLPLVHSGDIAAATYMWIPGAPDWVPAQELLPQLFPGASNDARVNAPQAETMTQPDPVSSGGGRERNDPAMASQPQEYAQAEPSPARSGGGAPQYAAPQNNEFSNPRGGAPQEQGAYAQPQQNRGYEPAPQAGAPQQGYAQEQGFEGNPGGQGGRGYDYPQPQAGAPSQGRQQEMPQQQRRQQPQRELEQANPASQPQNLYPPQAGGGNTPARGEQYNAPMPAGNQEFGQPQASVNPAASNPEDGYGIAQEQQHPMEIEPEVESAPRGARGAGRARNRADQGNSRFGEKPSRSRSGGGVRQQETPAEVKSEREEPELQAHDIDFEVVGGAIQMIQVTLAPGEHVISSLPSMRYIENEITYDYKMGSGEKIDLNEVGDQYLDQGENPTFVHFHNKAGIKRRVMLSGDTPGKILDLSLRVSGGSFLCRKESFLCASMGTRVNYSAPEEMGESFFKVEGKGKIFLNIEGMVIKKELRGDTLRIEEDTLVGFTSSLESSFQTEASPRGMIGMNSSIASFKGYGIVYMQSMPFPSY